MKQHILKKISFCMLMLAISNMVYAYKHDELKILCPTIDNMHASAHLIDSAGLVNGSYMATTPPFAIHEGGNDWFAIVYSIQAKSEEEAVKKARVGMSQIHSQKSIYADVLADFYWCEYDGGKIKTLNNIDESFLRNNA